MLRNELRAGSCGARYGANTATSTIRVNRISETIAVGLCANRREKLLGGGRAMGAEAMIGAEAAVLTLMPGALSGRNSCRTYPPSG